MQMAPRASVVKQSAAPFLRDQVGAWSQRGIYGWAGRPTLGGLLKAGQRGIGPSTLGSIHGEARGAGYSPNRFAGRRHGAFNRGLAERSEVQSRTTVFLRALFGWSQLHRPKSRKRATTDRDIGRRIVGWGRRGHGKMRRQVRLGQCLASKGARRDHRPERICLQEVRRTGKLPLVCRLPSGCGQKLTIE